MKILKFNASSILIPIICLLSSKTTTSQSCSYPYHTVRYANPTTSLTWSGSTTTTGGTITRTTQVFSSPDVYMRATWTARSSTSVTLSDFDNGPGSLGDVYRDAWQPFVSFPSHSNTTDTSWAEFLLEFSGQSNFSSLLSLQCLAMTVVDCDGSGNTTGNNAFKEMVQVELPVTTVGVVGSDITSGNIGNWLTLVSGFAVFPNIDTADKLAMEQLEFDSITMFSVRLGVIGRRNSSGVRQFSLHFRPYLNFHAPLPVQLTHFEALAIKNMVRLNWATVSEVNNSHFEVERSLDRLDWNTIGFVQGSINSHELIHYEFRDESPHEGANFYRLKQVDLNGESVFSQTVSVKLEEHLIKKAIVVYMSQTNQIMIKRNTGINLRQNIQIELKDISGKCVVKDHLISGENQLVLNSEMLSPGLYLVGNSTIGYEKLIISK
jgi:hypothetical protein